MNYDRLPDDSQSWIDAVLHGMFTADCLQLGFSSLDFQCLSVCSRNYKLCSLKIVSQFFAFFLV